ncbi:MAG: phosphate signaling complex protein PhoU [Desulfobulbaceae bacterium]|nr:phosphate signaling complex protein PhoU [Desulfobulbaceae bacterium]HIJ79516.1 phosphate signaling complex protein PhoU [Deltaproteobacteria bacterium]
MSKHLQRDIDLLKQKLMAMCNLVEKMLNKAVNSILESDEALAQEVIGQDSEVDAIEVDIEEECLKILALYQPVAIDLRFIIAAMKITSDLERVGDLTVNIAERAVFMISQKTASFPFDFHEMAQRVESMLDRSLEALVNLNVPLAYRVRSEDDIVDAMNREIYSKVKDEVQNNPETINYLLHALSIGRHLERVADHATNIAEDVIYLVDARIVRHQPEVFEE